MATSGEDYQAALARHHAQGAPADWQTRHVSAYASAHPWEDWAETWAHYLHMVDALDTAEANGMEPRAAGFVTGTVWPFKTYDVYRAETFVALMERWIPLTLALNSLNRSMGHNDFYPFVIPAPAQSQACLRAHGHSQVRARQGRDRTRFETQNLYRSSDARTGACRPLSIGERIPHQDRVLAFRRRRQQRHRTLDQFLDLAHVLHGLRRQLGPAPGPARRLRPALVRLVDRLDARLLLLPCRQAVEALAVELVADADLDLLKPVEHVELREGYPVDTRHLADLAHEHGIEPAAAPFSPGHRAELVAARADQLADVVDKLRRKRPRPDPRRIRLGNAEHISDGARPHARPVAACAATVLDDVTYG